jgi:hypothetical protein
VRFGVLAFFFGLATLASVHLESVLLFCQLFPTKRVLNAVGRRHECGEYRPLFTRGMRGRVILANFAFEEVLRRLPGKLPNLVHLGDVTALSPPGYLGSYSGAGRGLSTFLSSAPLGKGGQH